MRIFDGLAMAVNLKIMQLQRRHPDTVFETIELHKDAWADLIAYRMDSILYPSSEKEESRARAFGILVEALAHLAFAPGGVECFGLRFEATFCFRW
jgi:hypothetical protein